MFENTNADLVQVFEETVEDGNQISRRQLVSQYDRQLMDGERQRTPHLPLRAGQKHKRDRVYLKQLFWQQKSVIIANVHPGFPFLCSPAHQ